MIHNKKLLKCSVCKCSYEIEYSFGVCSEKCFQLRALNKKKKVKVFKTTFKSKKTKYSPLVAEIQKQNKLLKMIVKNG